MINLFNTEIEALSLHRVGNKSRKETMILSDNPYNLDDEIRLMLKEFFFKPFREKEESYFHFAHEVDLEYNELYNLCKQAFDLKKIPDSSIEWKPSPGRKFTFHEISKQITAHLFEQSNHPHIKNGEVYVTYLTNVIIDNRVVDAIGIFKSEILSDFLDIKEVSTSGVHQLGIELKNGIALDKLDKGCIIFNYREEEGYKILSVDSNKYDARYWLEHFLSVDSFHDEVFQTKQYLKLCNDFSKKVVQPAEDAMEKVAFGTASLNYFAKNDEFEEEKFIKEVVAKMENDDMVENFKQFRLDNDSKYSLEDVTSFPISNIAVNEMRSKFKNLIKLDTGVEIKLNFINPETMDQIVEKGWDEERQMYYYLIYYNKEEK